ncbi:MAG TPA: glycosyltransferase family 39 protein [Terracidiphilus sp.]|nr:glycosyltransferase family 39 protein [Terracidiphilus sp.]
MRVAERWVWVAVIVLLAVQATQMALVVHRESLTFDEDDHIFAGYMMGHTGDYGLNPEHPPLVKLLAALPLFGRALWVPPLHRRDFKAEAYLNGRDFLARNDGASQHLVFRMRLVVGSLALALTLLVFIAAREWFGTPAAMIALILAVFDPNIIAHSALVTTDMGVTLFFLAGIYGFYRYVKEPTLLRLLLAGVAAGLLLATKHSGILLAPMLLLLIGWEILTAPKGTRGRMTLRLSGAFAAIVVVGVLVLWAFYSFRYAARPAGLTLSTSLADYVAPLSHFDAAAVMAIAHLHLLPESYLMGLVDVERMAEFYPTFIFGKVYAHGRWWYFPAVILIKTTLGMLALIALAAFAILTGRLRKGRELAFLLIPACFYLLVAILAGMNIGARHLLPADTFTLILVAGGITALASYSRRWAWVGAALVLAHIASSLAAFPNYIPYANEAWGGPANVHNLLSDANVDWAQQLFQVKEWQDRHPGEECWFAYFARPEIDPAVYGIRCHALPNIDTLWLGGSDIVPPEIHGAVLISAGDLSGCEWPSSRLNPYTVFQSLQPDEMIDYGVLVYHGNLPMNQAAALSRAQRANELLAAGKPAEALPLALEAVAIDPEEIISQTALGDIAATLGQKDEARQAWQAAIASARQLEPDAQVSYIPDLEDKLKRL